MSPNHADGMSNSVDPDQIAHLGLHCLPRHIWLRLEYQPKALDSWPSLQEIRLRLEYQPKALDS